MCLTHSLTELVLNKSEHTFPELHKTLKTNQRFTVHPFVHIMCHMKIEFDPVKAAANPQNHEGVTFEEAAQVLLDPYTLTKEDIDAKNEVRFISLGMGAKGRILIVVWTLRSDNPRIISAWKANQPQRKCYEQQF